MVDNIQSAQAERVQKTVVQDDDEATAKQGTAGECSPTYDERCDDDDGLFDDTEFCSVDFDGAPRSPSFFGQRATLPVTYGEAQPAAIRPVTPEPELTTVAAVPKLPIPAEQSTFMRAMRMMVANRHDVAVQVEPETAEVGTSTGNLRAL
jgi:hypothetical protein